MQEHQLFSVPEGVIFKNFFLPSLAGSFLLNHNLWDPQSWTEMRFASHPLSGINHLNYFDSILNFTDGPIVEPRESDLMYVPLTPVGFAF